MTPRSLSRSLESLRGATRARSRRRYTRAPAALLRQLLEVLAQRAAAPDEALEVVAPEEQDRRARQRPHGRGGRAVAEQRHLAEHLAGAEPRQPPSPRRPGPVHDLDLARAAGRTAPGPTSPSRMTTVPGSTSCPSKRLSSSICCWWSNGLNSGEVASRFLSSRSRANLSRRSFSAGTSAHSRATAARSTSSRSASPTTCTDAVRGCSVTSAISPNSAPSCSRAALDGRWRRRARTRAPRRSRRSRTRCPSSPSRITTSPSPARQQAQRLSAAGNSSRGSSEKNGTGRNCSGYWTKTDRSQARRARRRATAPRIARRADRRDLRVEIDRRLPRGELRQRRGPVGVGRRHRPRCRRRCRPGDSSTCSPRSPGAGGPSGCRASPPRGRPHRRGAVPSASSRSAILRRLS